MTEQNNVSRLDILNKRDEFFAFILNEMGYFKEFLSTKSSKKWDLNSSILEDVYQKFLNLSKPSLTKIRELRTQIVRKRQDIIGAIKLYSKFLSSDSDDKIKTKFTELTVKYENELGQMKKDLDVLLSEKDEIIRKKTEYDNITREKIENIRNKIKDDKQLNISVEHQNIRNLVNEHKSFIRNEIEAKLISINDNLKDLNKKIKTKEEEHIATTYKYLESERSENKEEFMVLVDVEKEIILKTLKFQDYLEDVENFYNDQVTMYNILFKTKKIIKLNKANQIYKEVNDVIVDMASTERIFDDINKESLRAKYLINGKKSDTLKQIQSNLIGASETSSDTLLGMVKTKKDLVVNGNEGKEE